MILLDMVEDLQRQGIDACTLNNALNIAQLVALVALIRWIRNDQGAGER